MRSKLVFTELEGDMTEFLIEAASGTWKLLFESAFYILFGILVAGLLRAFINPQGISAHLGTGRFSSVFKAAIIGIPLPLCSCGVLPAAVSLKKQGANNGATTAFMIATPESGIDSISITYALLDPIMTVARPLAAFVTAVAAGITENLVGWRGTGATVTPDLSCPVDGCCDGVDCPPQDHRNHHGLGEKFVSGLKYAFNDVWADMAGWFFAGILLAGVITAIIPPDALSRYMGGGIISYLIMLLVGIPIYICATASTPIAAALILSGVSPGSALVFLLAGPATNITSLTVIFGILGKRAATIYLSSIALFSVAAGFAVDRAYAFFGVSARAVAGQASEIVPGWAAWASLLILLAISAPPLFRAFKRNKGHDSQESPGEAHGCGCANGTCGKPDRKGAFPDLFP